MSDRGSFVTEPIHCTQCAKGVAQVVADMGYHFAAFAHPMIIAGAIKGSYAGAEMHDFEVDWLPKIRAVICHPVRFAVLAEVGAQVFAVDPEESA